MIYYGCPRKENYYVLFCSTCGKTWTEFGNIDKIKCQQCGQVDDKCFLGDLSCGVIDKVISEIEIVDGTSIRGITRIVFFAYKNRSMLELKRNEIRKYSISLVPTPKFELEINGVSLRPTKSNIKKTVAYVSTTELSNTIFGALHVYKKEASNSLMETLEELMQNPWIEKLYNAGDKNLLFYRTLRKNRNLIDRNEPGLIKALHLNRSLFSLLIQNGRIFGRENISWKMLMDLIKRYNIQVTEQILKKIVEVFQTRRFMSFFEYKSFLTRYVSLLLMDDVQYDHERLVNYLVEDLYTYQGIEKPETGAQLLIDYIDMCRDLGVPFEKYPRSLKLVHDIAAKNQKEVIDEKLGLQFLAVVKQEGYRSLQYTGKNYMVIAPICPNDLVIEGAALSHCVGSYISKVIDHTAKILFMRNRALPNKAMITLEVRGDRLYQAAGYDNRQLTTDEREFVAEWGKIKNIDCSGYC